GVNSSNSVSNFCLADGSWDFPKLETCLPSALVFQWQRIWKWQSPNKIKHFMWIVMQGKLLTNMERARRHISLSDTCAACSQGPGTLDHLFRLCQFSKSIWSAIHPEVLSQVQLQLDFQAWWVNNVGNSKLNPSFGIAA
ncbi:Putative ribonuclease H protein At1g65750, partial [Linum perenne]